jgi:hypothetical protein
MPFVFPRQRDQYTDNLYVQGVCEVYVFLLRVDERRDDLGVCVLQCAKNVCETGDQEMGILASPLKERLFVPLLIRLIAHDGPCHLLVLLVDVLLCKGQ